MFQWASRCVPGFSIIALLSLSFAAFADIGYFLPSQDQAQGRGPTTQPGHHSGDRPEDLSLAQNTFISFSVFVHLNAFYFSLRLFFALVKTLRESKKTLQRRSQAKSKRSSDAERYLQCELQPGLSLDVLDAKSFATESKSVLGGEEVIHAIILPNYKEDFDTLRTTLNVLASHPRAFTQYEIYLAMESKEAEATGKAVELISTFEMAFLHIRATFHPSGVPGEIAGKSSNVAYAARRIMNIHARDDDQGVMNTLITVIDADTHLLQDYFNEVRRLHFDNVVSAEKSFYSCPIVFDRNSSETPILVRCADLMWGFAGISAMYPGAPISIPTSVYTLPLTLAQKAGGWDSNAAAIGEDMHMLLKCYFAMSGNITTRVVPSAASQCNISAGNNRGWPQTIDVLAARYRQALRHMWGALDTGYAIRKSIGNPSSPNWRLLFSGKQWALAHLLWEAHFLPCHSTLVLVISAIYSALTPPELIHPNIDLAFRFTGLLCVSSFLMMNLCMFVYDRWHYLCAKTRSDDMMDAGVLDAGFSFRNWWDRGPLLDRLIFPVAGTLFGPVPAVQAVFSHFWTEQLVYQVSQKPRFMSEPV